MQTIADEPYSAPLVPDNRDYKVIQVSDETLILGRVVGRYEAFINGWKP